MATQAERREATRRRVLDAARERFAHDGYEQTSTERIREQAGVSRGAMYHHFASKREVFEAVFQQVSDEAIHRAIRDGGTGGSRLDGLVRACLAWLREVQDPQVAAILLDQGPQALGWQRARDLESETSLGLMVGALERAAAAGEIDVVSIPLAARFLNAILAEAALVIVHDSSGITEVEVEQTIRQVLTGLTAD